MTSVTIGQHIFFPLSKRLELMVKLALLPVYRVGPPALPTT